MFNEILGKKEVCDGIHSKTLFFEMFFVTLREEEKERGNSQTILILDNLLIIVKSPTPIRN